MRRFNLEIICRDIMTKFVNKDTDIGDYNIKKNGQAIPPLLVKMSSLHIYAIHLKIIH